MDSTSSKPSASNPDRKPTPVIRAVGLGKAYSSGQFALRDVTIDIQRGEFVAVIGRSGAGKSTLLRCFNLLVRPTEGRLELNGQDITSASGGRLRSVRGRVGMVFQGFNLVRRLTVLQNVLAGRLQRCSGPVSIAASLFRWLPKSERAFAFECLDRVGISHLAFRRADTLSGGQQQRVAIARVLAQEPQVILADEPIASLDPESARDVMRTLRDIHETRGIPIIVNLHQVDVATEYASRILGVCRGRLSVDTQAFRLDAATVRRIYHGDPRPATGEGIESNSLNLVHKTPADVLASIAGA